MTNDLQTDEALWDEQFTSSKSQALFDLLAKELLEDFDPDDIDDIMSSPH